MRLAVICGMSDDKVRARLLPLTKIDEIEKIFLVRRSPLNVEKVKSLSPPSFFRGVLFFAEIFRIFTLCKICAFEKPAYLYSIYFVPHGIYAGIIGLIFHIPVIQELIGTDRLKITHSKFYQKLLSQAEHIGVRGSASRKGLASLGISDDKFFIPTAVNVLDFDLFSPGQSQKVYDLIYVGRMDQNKQIDLLIQAAAILHQQKPNLKMVLVGDGPERKNLEKLTAQLNLEDNITYTGRLDYVDIPTYLNQSSIFVMSSAFEGLPVAMLEALSCGLPVVVPDIGDISDIASHGHNAWLIKEQSPESYAQAFSTVLTDQELYHTLVNGALETRFKFLSEYSLDNAKKSWMDILNITDHGLN